MAAIACLALATFGRRVDALDEPAAPEFSIDGSLTIEIEPAEAAAGGIIPLFVLTVGLLAWISYGLGVLVQGLWTPLILLSRFPLTGDQRMHYDGLEKMPVNRLS